MSKEEKEYCLTLKRIIVNNDDSYSSEEVNKALKKLLDFLTDLESRKQG